MQPSVPASLVRRLSFVVVIGLVVASAAMATAVPRAKNERASFELEGGIRVIVFEPTRPARRGGGTAPTFDGDTYSFETELGAIIDDIFQCLDEHMSGMTDNTVLFDGLSELLDPYVNGTQPLVFEFETPGTEPDQTDATVNGFSDPGDDLFPEGFEDPKTGTPLDAACIEIGRDDLLDADGPVEVTNATLEMTSLGNTVIPPIDITSAFDSPWDGRLSIGFPGQAGNDIDNVVLNLTTEPMTDIFADGFESGDTSAWQ